MGLALPAGSRPTAAGGGGEQRVVERRMEVEEEADVWTPHVSEWKGEKQQGYFGPYENMQVCVWVQEHQIRIKWHGSKK